MFNDDSLFGRRENAIGKDALLNEIQLANKGYFEQIKKSVEAVHFSNQDMLLMALQKLENEVAAMMQECYETRDALSLSEYGKNIKSLLTGINQLILNIKPFDKNSNFKLSNAISELRKNNEAYWSNSKPALSKVATMAYPTTCVIALWAFLALTISGGSAILPAALPVCIGYLVISVLLINYMQCKVEDNRAINQVLNTINKSEQAQQLRTAEVDIKEVFDGLHNRAVLASFPALP